MQARFFEMSYQYYNRHADQFLNDTANLDMTAHYKKFLNYLDAGTAILDAGCGSGRDALKFKDLGFNVSAFNASIEMVKAAIKLTGLQIAQLAFEEISLAQKYDGIWACASLLHVERKNLKHVMINLAKSLNEGGVIYSSFKYGETERQKGERYFNDMNETLLKEIISDVPSLKFTEGWVSRDARKDRSSESWLNCILTTI